MKILRVTRENGTIHIGQQQYNMQWWVNFSLEVIKDRRQWNNIIKVLKLKRRKTANPNYIPKNILQKYLKKLLLKKNLLSANLNSKNIEVILDEGKWHQKEMQIHRKEGTSEMTNTWINVKFNMYILKFCLEFYLKQNL